MKLVSLPSVKEGAFAFLVTETQTLGETQIVCFQFKGVEFDRVQVTGLLEDIFTQRIDTWDAEMWELIDLISCKRKELQTQLQPEGA